MNYIEKYGVRESRVHYYISYFVLPNFMLDLELICICKICFEFISSNTYVPYRLLLLLLLLRKKQNYYIFIGCDTRKIHIDSPCDQILKYKK